MNDKKREKWIEFKRGDDEQNVGEEVVNEKGTKGRTRARERWMDER